MNGTYNQSPERQRPAPGPIVMRLEKTQLAELFINAAVLTYGPEKRVEPAAYLQQEPARPQTGNVIPLHPQIVTPNDEQQLRLEQARQNLEESYGRAA